MSEASRTFPQGPQRAHAAYVAIRTLELFRRLAAPMIFAFFFGTMGSSGRGSGVVIVVALVGFFVVAPVWALLSWYRFSYEITGSELRVYQGLIFRTQVFIPGRRVHTVDLSAGVFERVLGVVKVRVQTAGGGSTPEATLLGLRLVDAERLKAVLLGMQSAAQVTGESGVAGAPTEAQPSRTTLPGQSRQVSATCAVYSRARRSNTQRRTPSTGSIRGVCCSRRPRREGCGSFSLRGSAS